jgi:hypothetical protein
MFSIVIPVAAMVLGIAAGVFIGMRRRDTKPDDESQPGSSSTLRFAQAWLTLAAGWAARTAGRIRDIVGTLQDRVKTVTQKTPGSPGSQPPLPALSQDGDGNDSAAIEEPSEHDPAFRPSRRTPAARPQETSVNLGTLNCRARIGREPKGDTWQTVLILDICGAIEAPDDGHDADFHATLTDITDGKDQSPQSVLARPKQGPINRANPFSYQTGIGKLCRRHTVLEDWMTVAQISPEWFVLPRQGHRELRFNISIVSRDTGQQLAAGTCIGAFENLEIGYLDIEDNIQRAKTLAVGLAFSIGAANNALQDPEINVIHGWVRTNFGAGDASQGARLELEQALRKTAGFFLRGGRLNLEEICREIVEIAPMVGRLDIMDLSLRVAGAKGQVTAADIRLLKDLAQWLRIDRGRLRTMVEKTLPVSMHQSEDAEMILGVTTEMNKDEVRHQLNREYAKWSSRVISSDPGIRKQADQMLNLIANARTRYIGVKASQ